MVVTEAHNNNEDPEPCVRDRKPQAPGRRSLSQKEIWMEGSKEGRKKGRMEKGVRAA